MERAVAGVDVRLMVDYYTDVIVSDIYPTAIHRYPEVRAERAERKFLDNVKPKKVGQNITWVEYIKITTDDCIRVPFMGSQCISIKYKFKFRGRIITIDRPQKEYDVKLTSHKIIQDRRVAKVKSQLEIRT